MVAWGCDTTLVNHDRLRRELADNAFGPTSSVRSCNPNAFAAAGYEQHG